MRSVRALDATRYLIGFACILQAISTWTILTDVFAEGMLRTPFFKWLPVLTIEMVPLLIVAWLFSAALFMLGRHVRFAGGTLIACMSYAILVDQQAYSNHVYLLILVVAFLALHSDLTPTLLRIQLSIVYGFAALSKFNLVYISGAILANNMENGWLLPLPESFIRWEIMLPLALVSIFGEGFLAFGFWFERYRRTAFIVGVGLHLSIVLAFPADVVLELIVFGLTMFAMYIQFLKADELRIPVPGWFRPQVASVSGDTIAGGDR